MEPTRTFELIDRYLALFHDADAFAAREKSLSQNTAGYLKRFIENIPDRDYNGREPDKLSFLTPG